MVLFLSRRVLFTLTRHEFWSLLSSCRLITDTSLWFSASLYIFFLQRVVLSYTMKKVQYFSLLMALQTCCIARKPILHSVSQCAGPSMINTSYDLQLTSCGNYSLAQTLPNFIYSFCFWFTPPGTKHSSKPRVQ